MFRDHVIPIVDPSVLAWIGAALLALRAVLAF